ncbi:MAG: family 16 glycosylhydrolase [Gammaproteobacteria bacterium]|nr:family 16 glycosylhydrolase [Gammaproteobacteria bacterium]
MLERVCSTLILSTLLGSPAFADDGRAPTIPQSLSATAVTANSIELRWQSSTDSDGIKGYNVYRDGRFLATANTPYFLDQSATTNTTHEYWVIAFDNSERYSSTSRWVYARTPNQSAVPAGGDQIYSEISRLTPPQDLSAYFESDGSVTLDWSAQSADDAVAGYNVYRNNQYIATTRDSGFRDTQPTLQGELSYTLVAFSDSGDFSSHSAPVKVAGASVSPPPQVAPVIPTGLYSTVHSNNSLSLNWDRSEGAAGYNVYRDDQYVATVWTESWSDSGLSTAGSYRYSVVAFDQDQHFSRHSDDHAVNLASASASEAEEARINPASSNGEPTRSDTTTAAISNDYYLAFSDEFNSGGLDLGKWNTAYLWGPDVTTNNESQYYVDVANQPDFGYQPFSGNGEHLSITADRTPDWLRDRANGKPYLSGVMTSYDAFQFTYGYAEARLRAPTGKGNFAAFWLLNAKYVELEPEIDITELLGENPYVVHHTYHYYDANDTLVSSPTYDTWVDDFSREFHTYAVRWSPGEIVWYVDGRETQRLAHDKVSSQPMYVLFNLAIDGDWPQSPDANTVFPSSLEIDYVRVYRR